MVRKSVSNTSEQQVLKAGIRTLQRNLAGDRQAALQGLRNSTLRGLISQETELKGLMQSDVSAAQFDIRFLSLQQLLCIRADTLDFWTEVTSYAAHMDFLNVIDRHLFSMVARSLCPEAVQKVSSMDSNDLCLYKLGEQFIIVMGLVGILGQEDSASLFTPYWACFLDEQYFPDCKLACFNVDELQGRLLAAEMSEIETQLLELLGADESGRKRKIVVHEKRAAGKEGDAIHYDCASIQASDIRDVLKNLKQEKDAGQGWKNLRTELKTVWKLRGMTIAKDEQEPPVTAVTTTSKTDSLKDVSVKKRRAALLASLGCVCGPVCGSTQGGGGVVAVTRISKIEEGREELGKEKLEKESQITEPPGGVVVSVVQTSCVEKVSGDTSSTPAAASTKNSETSDETLDDNVEKRKAALLAKLGGTKHPATTTSRTDSLSDAQVLANVSVKKRKAALLASLGFVCGPVCGSTQGRAGAVGAKIQTIDS